MFEAIRSGSADLTLEVTLERLGGHPGVDGLALIGSEARGERKPESDVDLLVVLATRAKEVAYATGSPFEVVFTTIGGRPADVIVSTAPDLAAVLDRDWSDSVGHARESLVRWIAEGKLLVDRTGLLGKIAARASAAPPRAWDGDAQRAAWWSVNFSVAKTRRYASSAEDLYRTAAEWTVAALTDEALRAYFTVRGLPWRGEKQALEHWSAEDASFHSLVRTLFAAADLDRRVEAAARLAEAALAPVGGLWETGTGPRSTVWEALISGA